ncbi:MAG: flagella assembly protein FlgT middle domain-containing protein [Gallionella sp.]|nr:flagella assembly protein FlgT middle domain-containing protein [Gallionella sp.]
MLINVDFCFGNLLAASASKNGACRCFAAVFFASALFGVAPTIAAEPETVRAETPQTIAVHTERVRVEGVASIGAEGRNAARQAAISDALRKVSASPGIPAMAGKLVGADQAPQKKPDAQQIQQGNRYSILREWESQGKYYVAVSAEMVKGRFDAESATLIKLLKKKIAVIQFDVANTMHVDDINNIYDGLPAALASRLEASGRFLPTYTGRSIPMEADVLQRDAIIQIAGDSGAQILVYGRVVNAETSKERWVVDTPLDWSLKVPFGGYKKRHIEVELAVYDGFTGFRLFSDHLDEQAEGDVAVGNNKPFGSSFFLETEFGKAANRLVDSAVKNVQEALENVPFSAHIIRVEGRRVFLDAGADSLLEPGDKLVVYASDPHLPVVSPNGSLLGVTDHAANTVILTKVEPQISIGELSEDPAKLGIKAGNIARVNFYDQQELAAKQIAAQQLAKAQQEAKAEAERLKAEQAAQAEAARIKAEQAAHAEAARIKEEKKAKVQAVAEAKAAKLKAQQEAKAARGSAAQQARARALAVRIKAAQKAKAQPAAKAKSVKLKEKQQTKIETETSCAKAEQEAKNQAAACASAEAKAQQTIKTGAIKIKAGATEIKAEQKDQTKPEAQPAAASEEPQAVKAGEPKEKIKRIVLPPGQEALSGKTKSSKP